MQRFFQGGKLPLILLIALYTACVYSKVKAGEKWDNLLSNNLSTAAESKEKKPDSKNSYPEKVALLLADYLQARISADSQKQMDAASALLSAAKENPEGELFIYLLNNESLPNPVLYDEIKKLSTDGCAPNVASALARYKLQRIDSEELDEKQRAKLIMGCGRFGGNARISGPFNYRHDAKLQHPASAEIDPAAESYPESMGCATTVETIAPDKKNIYHTGNVLPENALQHTAVLQYTFTSEHGGEFLIRMKSHGLIRAFLNNHLIYTPEMFSEKCPQSSHSFLKIKLKKGVNCLLLKIAANEEVILEFMDNDGKPAENIHPMDFSPQYWKKDRSDNIAGYVFSQPVSSIYLDSLKKLCDSMPQPAGKILLATGLMDNGEILQAESLWQELYTKHPQSPFIKALYADFLLEIRYKSNDSSDRRESTAANLQRELQKEAPQFLLPQLQLADNYARMNQSKQQQELLQKLVGKFPDSAALQLKLSRFYQEKGWLALAMQAMDKYIEICPRGVHKKVNLLKEQKEFTAALKLAEKAYKNGDLICKECLEDLRKRCGQDETDETSTEKHKPTSRKDDVHDENKISSLEEKYSKALEEGDIQDAIRILSELVEFNPQNPYRREELGKLLLRNQQNSLAAKELTQAFITGCQQYEPQPRVLRLVRQIKGEKPLDETFLHKLTPEMIHAAQKGDDALASHATLLRSRIVELFPGIGGSVITRNAVKVFDRNGINYLSEQDTSGEILFCRTIDENGQEFVPDSAENLNLKSAMSMYNVQPGSVLDYASRQYIPTGSYASDSFEDNFYFQDFNADVQKAQYVLILPVQMLKYADLQTFPESFAPEIRKISSKRVALIWQSEKQSGVPTETGMPPAEKILRNLRIHIYPRSNISTEHFNYDNTIRSDSNIARKANDLCKDKSDRRAEVLAIYNWISQNIREEGYNQTPRDTFALKNGSASDMLELCRAMLAARGIRSWTCEVNSALSTPDYTTPENHVKQAGNFSWPEVLRVQMDDCTPDIWLQFYEGQRFFRMNDLTEGTPGALTLEQSPGGLTIGNVRAAEMDIESKFIPEKVELNADGSANVLLAMRMYGSGAADMRQTLQNPHEARQQIEQFASEAFPGITELKYEIKGDKNYKDKNTAREGVNITASGKVLNFSQPLAARLIFQRNIEFYSPYLATTLPRRYPLLIAEDITEADQQHYTAPEGWAFITPPDNCWLQTKFGVLSVNYSVEGRTLRRSVFTVIPAQRIKPEDCAEFNQFLAEIKKRLEASFTLEKIPSGAITSPFKDKMAVEGFPGSYLQPKHLPDNLREYMKEQRDKRK